MREGDKVKILGASRDVCSTGVIELIFEDKSGTTRYVVLMDDSTERFAHKVYVSAEELALLKHGEHNK